MTVPQLTLAQAWWVLALAILLEVGGTTCMRLSEGFTRLVPTALTVASMAVSLALLGLALKSLPLTPPTISTRWNA